MTVVANQSVVTCTCFLTAVGFPPRLLRMRFDEDVSVLSCCHIHSGGDDDDDVSQLHVYRKLQLLSVRYHHTHLSLRGRLFTNLGFTVS